MVPDREVGGARRSAAADPAIKLGLLMSPINGQYRELPQFGANAGGLAYAVLLIGGGVVVGLGVARVRLGCLVLWIGFAALSLLTVFAIPFFAVVAVPLVAAELNALSARVGGGTWANPKTRFVLLGSGVGSGCSLKC